MDIKNVSIRLVSSQSDGEQKEQTELMSEGKYEKLADGYKISYEESEATGYEGSVTTLSVLNGKKVVMERSGSVSSNLVVEMGKKHHCVYGTPYGDFMVGITARSVNSALDDNGGKLYFGYVIDINSSYIGDFEILIEVK